VPPELPISPLTISSIDLHYNSTEVGITSAGYSSVLDIDLPEAMRNDGYQEKLVENLSGHSDPSHEAWEQQLADVGMRMKDLHSRLIDEEVRLLASVTRRALPMDEEETIAPMSCCYPKSVTILPRTIKFS